MNRSHHVTVANSSDVRGVMMFFDEPFGEPTSFDSAWGFTIQYEDSTLEGGRIDPEDHFLGLGSWLAMNHWRQVEDMEALVAG